MMSGMDALAGFSGPTRAWFGAAFETPTAIQSAAWPHIRAGRSVLAVAPTGSGKTLAAFLWAIDRCLTARQEAGVRVLYVSPLKALAFDVERNLRAPLAGIAMQAGMLGQAIPSVRVGLRTGDTPAAERQAMTRRPPDVLITTPESLFLLLTSRARSALEHVETVIVDEVHAVAGSKRGAHLAVSLARLDRLVGRAVPRIGLSATVRPLSEAARFLAGDQPVEVVDVPSEKRWDLRVEVPVPDLSDLPTSTASGEPTASIWPHVEERIWRLVRAHRSTIVFANSRRLAERLTARLNEIEAESRGAEALAGSGHGRGADPGSPDRAGGDLASDGASDRRMALVIPHPALHPGQSGMGEGAPPVIARAHHGSMSREQRRQIEEDLKSGRLPAVVATSSLELGIDMGAVDLVIQVEAPPSVASGLQRVGRAGHQVGAVSRGVVLPKFRADLLASAVVVERMRQGKIETLQMPSNPLDVVAQQVVASVAMDEWEVGDLLAMLRSTANFADLTRGVLDSVLDMLSGRYPADAFAELRPRLVWDRVRDVLTARPGAQRLAVTSGGTIPDRGLFSVHVADGGRIGELDEEMVYESRVGDTFALGSSSWRIVEITHDRVNVVPAPGTPARLPYWHGDAIGRSAELGRALGEFTRRIAGMPPEEARARLAADGLDPLAVENLMGFLNEQQEVAGHVPSDRTILVERARDEVGDWRIAVLTPFGGRVHGPWALVARDRLQVALGIDADVLQGDDGFVVRLPDLADDRLDEVVAALFPEPDDVEAEVTRLVGGSALFAARFRECAARALLLPRMQPGRRAPLWQQRLRSAQLLQVAAQHPQFPIVLETVRECLRDVYDLPALIRVLTDVRDRRIRVVQADPPSPSPFARSLLFGYVATFMYEGDSPLAERRAAALTLDASLLAELLGETDLSELLEPEAIAQVIALIQRTSPERHARNPDEAADMLRALGPLSTQEAALRGVPEEWLGQLEMQRRVFRARIGGQARWAASEDASRLRDGLGVVAAPGIPRAFLEPVADAVGDLVARYARTHGPFTTAHASTDLGLPLAVVEQRLRQSRAAGQMQEGRFSPGSTGVQWCAPMVLSLIKRRTVALLRHEAEPVSQQAFARFLPEWHGVGPTGPRLRGSAGVLAALRDLAGAPVPATALEQSILPTRVRDYEPGLLDALTATGEVLWTGSGSLPSGDGWVVVVPAEDAGLLPRGSESDLTSVERIVLSLLQRGGGWFTPEITRLAAADPAWSSQAGEAGSTDAAGPGPEAVEPGAAARRGRGPAEPDPAAELAAGVFGPEAVAGGLGHEPDAMGPADARAGLERQVAAAIRALLWGGFISNDTLAPVRQAGAGRTVRATRDARSRRPRGRYADLGRARGGWPGQPGSAGKSWAGGGGLGRASSSGTSVTSDLPGRWFALAAPDPDPTMSLVLRVQALLDRFGLATRAGAASSGIPGGYSAAYRVLLEMESRGRAQRVYAVQGLGGSQFALPGVVDRLREVERELFAASERPAGADPPPEAIVLAASDPANPFGTALPWPPSAQSSGADRATERADGIAAAEPASGAVARPTPGVVPPRPGDGAPGAGILGSGAVPFGPGAGAPGSATRAGSHRPSRSAGCHVVLCGGLPVLFIERGGHSLLSFAADHGAPVGASASSGGESGRQGRGESRESGRGPAPMDLGPRNPPRPDHAVGPDAGRTWPAGRPGSGGDGKGPFDRTEQVLASAATALRTAIALGRVSELMITRIDGEPALGHLDKPLGRALVAAGATVTPRGFRMRSRP